MSNKSIVFLNTPVYIVISVVVLIGLLFAFIGLSEFYNVSFGGEESAYAFGPINENQWYYQSAAVYKTYNLISGLLFLLSSTLTIWATIMKKGKGIILGAVLITFLFLVTSLS